MNITLMNRLFRIFSVFVFALILVSCEEDDEGIIDNNTEEAKDPAVISQLLPETSARIGDTITIIGTKFRTNSTNKQYVKFDTIEVKTAISWKDSEIKMIIPDELPFGEIKISVFADDTLSNEISFIIIRPEYIPVEMINISKGSFTMGDIQKVGFDNELPTRQITLSRDFMMGKYEITQAQWLHFMNLNPSTFRADSLPINGISWNDCITFCNLMSEEEGLEKCYDITDGIVTCDFDKNGYRLPTEAEWEYACRAGTETSFYTGDTEESLGAAAWYIDNMPEGATSQVPGQKTANAFGLYDMHGNVSEYCWDWFSLKYDESELNDPTGAEIGPGKVLRGGSWNSPASSCRSSFRYYYRLPEDRYALSGIRVVRTIK